MKNQLHQPTEAIQNQTQQSPKFTEQQQPNSESTEKPPDADHFSFKAAQDRISRNSLEDSPDEGEYTNFAEEYRVKQ